MRAVVLRETGGPDRLMVEDVAEPDAPAVEVRAAGVNFLDILVRRGEYPQMPEFPHVPGIEVAGLLDGRRVMALPRQTGGGYAERVAVDPEWAFPLPDDASFEEGASFLMTFVTAWLPLTRQARVDSSSTVVVHAAAGGVGSAAVQLARYLGAHVVGTASSEEKRLRVLELGADEALAYDEFGDRVRADVVLDPVGGAVFAASLPTLKPLGVIVAVGFAGGLWEELNPAVLVGRNVGVQGFYLGRLMAREPELVRTAVGELLDLWRGGAVKPLVGATFPLERTADAHRLVEERQSVGKVVLIP